MIARPIPLTMLPHSAVLITKSAPDRWGNCQEENAVTLKHVYIEPSSKVTYDTSKVAIQLSAVLFFDCKNSSPADVTFALNGDTIGETIVERQLISFSGRQYTVATIEPYYAGKILHHYEVGLT